MPTVYGNLHIPLGQDSVPTTALPAGSNGSPPTVSPTRHPHVLASSSGNRRPGGGPQNAAHVRPSPSPSRRYTASGHAQHAEARACCVCWLATSPLTTARAYFAAPSTASQRASRCNPPARARSARTDVATLARLRTFNQSPLTPSPSSRKTTRARRRNTSRSSKCRRTESAWADPPWSGVTGHASRRT
jgi:hypothetical protein